MPLIIAIAGSSCSGKTTLGNLLKKHFGENCVNFSIDNYYKNAEDVGERGFDNPEALDWSLFIEHLKQLQKGEEIDLPIYDFVTSSRQGSVPLKPKNLIIIDGILSFYTEELRQLIDIPIFIDVDDSLGLSRRLERDPRERGRSETSVRAQWIKVSECFELYAKQSKSYAFFQVQNNTQCQETELNIKKIILDLEEIINLRANKIPTAIYQRKYSLFECEKPSDLISQEGSVYKI